MVENEKSKKKGKSKKLGTLKDYFKYYESSVSGLVEKKEHAAVKVDGEWVYNENVLRRRIGRSFRGRLDGFVEPLDVFSKLLEIVKNVEKCEIKARITIINQLTTRRGQDFFNSFPKLIENHEELKQFVFYTSSWPPYLIMVTGDEKTILGNYKKFEKLFFLSKEDYAVIESIDFDIAFLPFGQQHELKCGIGWIPAVGKLGNYYYPNTFIGGHVRWNMDDDASKQTAEKLITKIEEKFNVKFGEKTRLTAIFDV